MRSGPASELPVHWQAKDRAGALAQARLEFAEALFDIHSVGAADTLERIAISRSMHELWHLREQIFSHVACRHDQSEAAGRLKELDAHFPRRHRYATLPPPDPRGPSS